MASTQTETKSVKTTNPAVRKKLSVQKIDLAKQPAGYAFKGKYCGTSQSEPFSKVIKGEVVTKTLTFAIFEDDKGDRFKVIQDQGLRTALADAMIKENQTIEVVKLDKSDISGGRTMNQYDVFSLEA